MRVSGLSSGMDIDSIVQQMMTAKRIPLDKLTQKKQTLEWKRDSYRQINSQLVDFRNNKLWKYRSTSEMNAFKSEVTGDTSAITVQATPSSNQVKMDIEVTSLATQRSKTSTESLGPNVTGRTTLSSLGVTKENPTLTVSRGGDSVIISFSKDDTIDSVIRKINNHPQANVTAALDEATGKFTLKSKEYGNQTVVFGGDLGDPQADETDPSAPIVDPLKLKSSSYAGGEKAKVKINSIDKEFDNNTFTINGVIITLNSTTEVGKPSTITTKVDSTKMLETIKSFIKDYNSVLSTMNTKLGEERHRDFPPLTDEQKKEMKEDDIKRWQERAQSGLLKNDDILRTAVSDMRNSVVNARVSNSSISLSSIGITTGQYYENGKLVLDEAGEAKLKKAIEDNPDQVMELFIGSPTNPDSKGLFNELYEKLAGPLESISKRAGTSKYSTDLTIAYNTESVMGLELKGLNDRISETQKKLSRLETQYYTQFTAMEKAINRFNAQSTSLSGFLAQ